MDVLFRAAERVLALIDALRDKRVANGRIRIPVTRRLHSGSSNTSDWDRHRPGHFVSRKM